MFRYLFCALALLAALAALPPAKAQTFGEFLNQPALPVTFLGVDFSQARYYGPQKKEDPAEMVRDFALINELLVQEAGKYDIAKALHRAGPVVYATQVAGAANRQLDTAQLVVPARVTRRPALKVRDVEQHVKSYVFAPGSQGVALAFVVEELDKTTDREVLWATFVDLATGQLLYTEKMGGSGAGFGFRNYWSHPLDSCIDLMKAHYGQWKKKFAAKS